MRKILVTFGGAGYDMTTAQTIRDAPRFGADAVWVYDDLWLTGTEFYRMNQWLWRHHGDRQDHPRGFGWFCWKPFIILDAIAKIEPGDVVLYLDADTRPIADLNVLFAECARNQGFLLFSAAGCQHQHWCKRDCLVVMAQDEDRYRFSPHAVARFMLFQKGRWAVEQFLMEWLTYCLNPLAQTFDPSVILPEYPELREHRTEQAIFTCLAHKYGQRLYREACQFGESSDQDRELYPQLFMQDGERLPGSLQGSRFRNVPPRE